MKPHWINNTFIGSFWMGSAAQKAQTQEAIDEECALYEEAATHDDENTNDEEIQGRFMTETETL